MSSMLAGLLGIITGTDLTVFGSNILQAGKTIMNAAVMVKHLAGECPLLCGKSNRLELYVQINDFMI